MNIKVILLCLLMIFISSCNEEAVPTESEKSTIVSPGDILISNVSADNVVILNPDGSYKGILLQLNPYLDSPYGLSWSSDTNEVLIAINGNPDRILAIDVTTGASRRVGSSGLSGNVRDLSVMPNGDIIVIESNALERYAIDGSRVIEDWPLTGQQTTMESVMTTDSGDILMCGRGSDEVGIYDEEGSQLVAEISSGISSTTDCYGVAELGNGNIAVSWVGTSDTVAIYSPDLTTEVATFSAVEVIGSPRAIAPSFDGTQFYVLDGGYSNLHLFDNDGSYVSKIETGVLSIPNDILVVPLF